MSRSNQRAGRLRTLCQLEQHNGAISTRGAIDDAAANWISQAEVWASVEPLTAGEAEHAHQRHANATHRVELRYMPSLAIGPQHRLRIKGTSRLLNLGGALDIDERRRKVRCMAAEEISDWTPAELSPAVWLHAADLSATHENAAAVTSWADRSGNSQDMSRQAAGVTFEAGELPAVVFDGIGYMSAPADAARADFGAWLAVLTPGNEQSDAVAACFEDTASESGSLAMGFRADDNAAARYRDEDVPTAGASQIIATHTTPALLILHRNADGSAGSFTYNNANPANVTAWPWTAETNEGNAAAINLTIGGAVYDTGGSLQNPFSGKVHELLIFNDWHEPEKIEQAARDLLRRWQIS